MKLEIKHLSSGYETGTVLHDLTLSLREGEFLSLLGPSGCGKTTLMKTIAGIVPASAGSIYLDGQEITGLPIHRRGTVILFQDLRLFPHKTALQNVEFPMKMQEIPKKERQERALSLLQRVQMAPFAHRRPGELSGGQQQRVALARALAAEPKLLLLDEPFSALDENLREEMRALVLELKREFSMTVILVTHDRQEALSMSDRVALLFDGEIIQTGSPREVYHRPASRRAADYFGNCVYIPGVVTGGQFRGGGITCPADRPDGDYTLMLRPGCLKLGGRGYPMTVEQVTYRGGDTLVSLLGPGGTRWHLPQGWDCPWQPGDRIEAEITVTDPLLFEGN